MACSDHSIGQCNSMDVQFTYQHDNQPRHSLFPRRCPLGKREEAEESSCGRWLRQQACRGERGKSEIAFLSTMRLLLDHLLNNSRVGASGSHRVSLTFSTDQGQGYWRGSESSRGTIRDLQRTKRGRSTGLPLSMTLSLVCASMLIIYSGRVVTSSCCR